MTQITSIYDLAYEFAEFTTKSIFVTGNAGTGKTTFLKKLRKTTTKQMAVVAPTGIAAINAEGVTIHSFFQLPFTPFVPTPAGRQDLINKIRLNSARKRVIKELDMLVIDEISMVRADLLDEIDTVLRHVRYRYNEPFGGVQMVYIGDLYQLPPVVTSADSEILLQYYSGAFFFNSHVIQEQPPIYIELDKIFRQTDLQFIKVLNEIRNNSLTQDGMDIIKSRHYVHVSERDYKNHIFLTTHNVKADAVNENEMRKIKSPSYIFTAETAGDFPDKLYPNDYELELKSGAKVMFIANNPSAGYYNGKIGFVTKIDQDNVYVKCEDSDNDIQVKLEEWKNVKYNLNKETNKIEENEVGSYRQYPLRLAWAITIHKSQGMTFDKVIVDTEDAFSHGQVYVAFSRCRTLDGIVLGSYINKNSLGVNSRVADYVNSSKLSVERLNDILSSEKTVFTKNTMINVFSFKSSVSHFYTIISFIKENKESFNNKTQEFLETLKSKLFKLDEVSTKLQGQLYSLWTFDGYGDGNDMAKARMDSACDYFSKEIGELLKFIENTTIKSESKNHANECALYIKDLYSDLARKQYIFKEIKHNYYIENLNRIKQNFVSSDIKLNLFSHYNDKPVSKIKNQDLFDELKNLRNSLAAKENIPPYCVFNNSVIQEMAEKMPCSKTSMTKISGIGGKKFQKYGEIFIKYISNYRHLKNHGKPMF